MRVDLKGICIYPVTDRPDWDGLHCYCQCGLYDLNANKDRLPNETIWSNWKNASICTKAF